MFFSGVRCSVRFVFLWKFSYDLFRVLSSIFSTLEIDSSQSSFLATHIPSPSLVSQMEQQISMNPTLGNRFSFRGAIVLSTNSLRKPFRRSILSLGEQCSEFFRCCSRGIVGFLSLSLCNILVFFLNSKQNQRQRTSVLTDLVNILFRICSFCYWCYSSFVLHQRAIKFQEFFSIYVHQSTESIEKRTKTIIYSVYFFRFFSLFCFSREQENKINSNKSVQIEFFSLI